MNTKMKMRMLSLLLCFVMLVGLMPITALAADTYTVTVTGGTASPAGPYTVDTEVIVTADPDPEGKKFKEWQIEGLSTTTSESRSIFFYMPANNVTITAIYEDANIIIESASATITEPVVGANPDFNIVSADESKYTVTVVKWNLLDGSSYPVLTAGDKFVRGESYQLDVKFVANPGYEFSDSCVYNVNGVPRAAYSLTKGERRCYFDVYEIIDTINVKGVVAPVAGAIPDVSGITSDTEGINVIDVKWRDKDGYAFEGNPFVAGEKYILWLKYEIESGYKVADDAEVTFNISDSNILDKEITHPIIKMTYEIPAASIPTTYTVTFDSDGGSAVTAQNVESGQTATEPTAPTKEGYTFKGWFNGETEYDFDTAVTAPITLKAKWEENAPTPTLYNVWVAGTQVTSANAADVLGDGAASYNPTTNTLTVSKNITATGCDVIQASTENNFNVVIADGVILTSADDDGIYYYGDGVLTVTGNNINISASGYTIYGSQDVIIDCDDLTITGSSYGIYADYGTANLTAKDVSIEAVYYAIYGYEDVTVDCADLTITSDEYDGIYAGDGSVDLTAGNVTISAVNGSGIAAYGSAKLTVDGDVTIDAGVYGIYGYEDITIDCADLTITSDGYDGIYAGDGSVDLTAGNVTISAVNGSGIAAYGSAKLTVDGDVTIDAVVHGIYGYEDVTVDCADLTITGSNFGICADFGDVGLKAEDVTIEADDFAIYGYEDVTVDCADLTITSSNFGIYADFGDVGLKAEDVTIEAVVAIYGGENVTVDCADLTITGSNFGIYADGSVNLKAGDVAIEADDSAIYGYEDITIDCDTANIIGVYRGIVAPGCSIIIEKGNFDIQSTEAGEYDASYHALYFGEDFTYPAGTTVVAATEVDGTFVPYVEENNDTYDHVKITVPASVQPTVALNKSAITLTAGGTETLVPTITPADLPNYALSWTSDDESVATVDYNGTVTAVAPGTATITVTLMPGAMPRSEEDPVLPTATCVVTVVEEDVPQEPTTSVTVTKEWNVPETFDRADLPESVRVAIYANGEKLLENVLSERNEWTWTKELPAATEDGTPIVYTVDELEVPDGYEKTISEAVETDTGIEITITNTLVEEDDKENEEGGNGGATTPTTPSAPSTPSVPDTGDNTNTLGWMITLLFTMVALVIVIKKKKEINE